MDKNFMSSRESTVYFFKISVVMIPSLRVYETKTFILYIHNLNNNILIIFI